MELKLSHGDNNFFFLSLSLKCWLMCHNRGIAISAEIYVTDPQIKTTLKVKSVFWLQGQAKEVK